MNLPSRIRRIEPLRADAIYQMSIADLSKLYNCLVRHSSRATEYEARRVAAMNSETAERLRTDGEKEALTCERKTLGRRKEVILNAIGPTRIGFLSRTLLGTKGVSFDGDIYALSSEARIAELIDLRDRDREFARRLATLEDRYWGRKEPNVTPPQDSVRLKINGVTTPVPLVHFNASHIAQLLERRKTQAKVTQSVEVKEVADLRAQVATTTQQKRRQARKYRPSFPVQTRLYPHCPYCANPFSFGESHLEHIYPIHKGGQSTSINLVFVCRACNQKKGKHTIATFAEKNLLNYHEIRARLLKLGKDC